MSYSLKRRNLYYENHFYLKKQELILAAGVLPLSLATDF